MKKILLISDTHSHLDQDILDHIKEADEIWHGGDIGDLKVLDEIKALKPLVAVYGNIDHGTVRHELELNEVFYCEGVKVLITHIAGYPGKYYNRVKDLIKEHQPDLFICGHSHICKVMRDPISRHLHMNPGACGHFGFHKIRTMLRFECDRGKIQNLNVIELGIRGRLRE